MRSVPVNGAARSANPELAASSSYACSQNSQGRFDDVLVVDQRQQLQRDRTPGLAAAQHISFPALLEDVQVGQGEPVERPGDGGRSPACPGIQRHPARQQT